MNMLRNLLSRTLALIGLALLILSGWGVVVPNDQRAVLPKLDLMPYDAAIAALEAIDPTQPAPTIITQATNIVHLAMSPRSPEHTARVPARQNWLLWLAGEFDTAAVACGLTGVPDLFSVYQMTDHRRALQRGFGLCSQQALVLAGFLDEQFGYRTHIAALSGHVVLQVTLPDGSLMLADPHKGVVLPFGLDYAQTHISEVAAAYPAGSYVAQTYGPEGNQLVDGPASAYNPKLYLLEKASYLLIWIIPVLLMLPAIFSRKRP